MAKFTKTFITAMLIAAFVATGAVGAVELKEPADGISVDTTIPRLEWTGDSAAELFEVIIWAEDGNEVKFHAFPRDTSITVEENKLQRDKTYIWSVRERAGITEAPKNDFETRFTFTIGEDRSEDPSNFKKTGCTLVIPVEFSDYTFASEGSPDYRVELTKKMDGMGEYFRILSRGSEITVEQCTYDIAPKVTIGKTLAHYGRDRKIFGKTFVDTGDFFPAHMGPHMMKRVAVKETFKRGIPVNKYDHLIYITPGDAGFTDDDRIWPHSVSGSPHLMVFVPHVNLVIGHFIAGIVQGIKVNTGTFCHEFGHQLGLPDLYPYDPLIKTKWFSIGGSPNRDLGLFGMMASGNHYGKMGVGMCALSKKRSYGGKRLKKNWLEGQVKYVTESGEYVLNSRDSHTGTTGLVVDIPATSSRSDCFVVELFDRKRTDKDMMAYSTIDGRFTKLNAGVFIYRANSDNVDKISTLKPMPYLEGKPDKDQVDEWERYFLAGGKFPSGGVSNQGVMIEVKSMEDAGDHWTATIAISMMEK